MKPVIALVGRPNVGKSTLFNRMTRSRSALVADQPGLTRDRHYGHGNLGEKSFIAIDTGGFEPVPSEAIFAQMARQTLLAIDEADLVIFIVDGRGGLHPQDKAIAETLRERERPLLLAVNKVEGIPHAMAVAEFHELGLGEPCAISAAHGEGVREMLEFALDGFSGRDDEEPPEEGKGPRVAIVGRPNVGKSTLINTLVGEERVIAFDQPGTTRDSIAVEMEYAGRPFTLVDTAGMRRRGKVNEVVEKFSVVKTLQAIDDANVAVLLLDAREDISDQDAHIAGYILESGRALVVGINKWDGLDAARKEHLKTEFQRKLRFLDFARLHYLSALQGSGVRELMKSVSAAYAAAMAKLPTPKLSKLLHEFTAKQAPPQSGLFRPKLRYAHQGGSNPPVIVIHGNAVEHISTSYRRYLENSFRQAFGLQGTPLRVEFRQGRNPFAERGSKPITQRQENKARREKRFRRRAYRD